MTKSSKEATSSSGGHVCPDGPRAAKNEVTRALTEDGDDHAVLQHLHGAVEEVEDVLERVALVDEELVGRAEVGLEGEGELSKLSQATLILLVYTLRQSSLLYLTQFD